MKISDVGNLARRAQCKTGRAAAAAVNRWPSSPPQPISSTHPRGCIQDPALRIPAAANCNLQFDNSLSLPRVYMCVRVQMSARACSFLVPLAIDKQHRLTVLKLGRFCSSSVAFTVERPRSHCLHGRDNDTSIPEHRIFHRALSLRRFVEGEAARDRTRMHPHVLGGNLWWNVCLAIHLGLFVEAGFAEHCDPALCTPELSVRAIFSSVTSRGEKDIS